VKTRFQAFAFSNAVCTATERGSPVAPMRRSFMEDLCRGGGGGGGGGGDYAEREEEAGGKATEEFLREVEQGMRGGGCTS
jgi:hypothetical protein